MAMCVSEVTESLRGKSVRSATLERLGVTREADARVRDLPQPLQFSRGLGHILDNLHLPVRPRDRIVGRIEEEVPDEEGERLLAAAAKEWNGRGTPPWMRDVGHVCFDWDRLLREGLAGLQAAAEGQLRGRRGQGQAGEAVYLEGAVGVYQALRRYASRYAAAADAGGLHSCGAWCRAVADGAPATFAEAIQLMWLVGLVFCAVVTPNSALTFGRMDQLLLPFYRRDLAAGRLTRAEAGELFLDFCAKTNLLLGRGEHQMSGEGEKSTGWLRNLSFDYTPYIVLGGCRGDGSPAVNELTELLMEQVVPQFKTPDVVLRYTPDVPDAFWRAVCEKARRNASVFVYNDAKVIPALEHAGVPANVAIEYTMRGCNAVALPGSNQCAEHYIWLLNHVRDSLVEAAAGARSMNDVYAVVRSRVRRDLEEIVARISKWKQDCDTAGPDVLRFEDCFSIGTIERARSAALGADTNHGAQICIGTLGNAADSLAAVDTLVFGAGGVSLGELVAAMRDDYAGGERLRLLCVHAPKFGRDDDAADSHAVALVTMVLEELARLRRAGGLPGLLLPCTQSNLHTIVALSGRIGATPDGRRAGQPVSDNTSPAAGSCTRGPTAMFRSLAKLPMDRLCSGALNVRLHPGYFAGPDGLRTLAAMLRAYLDEGGLQVQLSLADTAQLRDAQRRPESHRELMVRITGYSAVFIDMSRKAQDEIIRREELGPAPVSP